MNENRLSIESNLWARWAVSEGGAKAASRILQKFLGTASGSLAGVFVSILVIGAVQVAGGFLIGRFTERRIAADRPEIFGGVLFGVIASVMTFLGVYSFTFPGADVGVTTFIVTLSIIPGALIDWVFFGHRLMIRQWLAIGVFLLSGYAMLNFPNLQELAELPPWVWITLVIALLFAVNEAVTQAVKKMDPFAYNFWVGITTVLVTAVGLLFLPRNAIRVLPNSFWLVSIAVGAIVIAMISFKIMAYKAGGSIAFKKLVVQSSYLILATLAGALLYAESLTVGKLVGISGFVLAFLLMDRNLLQSVQSRF